MMKASDNITKSSRHQKIIGEFGEQIVSNWLSRSGFEVAIVDCTLYAIDDRHKIVAIYRIRHRREAYR